MQADVEAPHAHQRTLADTPPLPDDVDADARRLLLLEIWLHGARHPATASELAADWRAWLIRTEEQLCSHLPESGDVEVEDVALSGAAIALMVPLGGVLGVADRPDASALRALAVLQRAQPPHVNP